MMAASCSLVESERKKEAAKIVEIDVRVRAPTEDVRNEPLTSSHEARLPLGPLLGRRRTDHVRGKCESDGRPERRKPLIAIGELNGGVRTWTRCSVLVIYSPSRTVLSAGETTKSPAGSLNNWFSASP
jgi:hypothetical protein